MCSRPVSVSPYIPKFQCLPKEVLGAFMTKSLVRCLLYYVPRLFELEAFHSVHRLMGHLNLLRRNDFLFDIDTHIANDECTQASRNPWLFGRAPDARRYVFFVCIPECESQ